MSVTVRLRFNFHEVELAVGRTTLGREGGCTITLSGVSVSREHAQIDVMEGTTAIITDLASRNGVLVNGGRIAEPRTLHDGDRIRIGAYDLVVSIQEGPGLPSKRITGKGVICEGCGELFGIGRPRCPACDRRVE